MKSKNVIVLFEEGLHLRIASEVAKIAQRAGGSVQIRHNKGCPRANACSVLELLTLGATAGTSLEIVADGPNEEAVLRDLSDVFKQGADT